MSIQSLKPISISPDKARLPNLGAVHPSMRPGQDKTREAFQSFVGETLFGQMLKSMRKTVGKTPYFNGGRAEEVFQQQLDQVLAQKMSRTSGERLASPMFNQFMMQQRSR